MSGPPRAAGPRAAAGSAHGMAEDRKRLYLRAQGADAQDDLSRRCCSEAMSTLAVDEIHQLPGAMTSDQRDGPHQALGPLLGSRFEVLDPHVVPALRSPGR